MISNEQTNQLKDRLEKQKASLEDKIQSARNTRMDLSERDSVSELSAYDNHPADLGTELFEREKDIALHIHEEEQMNRVGDALQAIKEGTYGKCKECGEDIPFERLEAIPETLYCTKHAEIADRRSNDKRPSEESIIKNPRMDSMQRSYDPRIEDYRDSFADAARYGTSETPSDMVNSKGQYDDMYPEEDLSGDSPIELDEFVGNGPDGERTIYQNEDLRAYEEELDEEGVESPLGDIPYRKKDSYITNKKD
ncbi:TraR/DksA C4-type zinc finger protein [Pradoshia sp.]